MTTKTHFHSNNVSGFGGRFLFCTGRHVVIANTSDRLDDVDCGACKRKLVAQSKKVRA